jgi:hypothetical protein
MAGDQINPSISGSLIAFESDGDIFVYDMATNTLYQVTNTPSIVESLADLWLAPDGFVRVVYTAQETDRNVYVKTFFVGTAGADPIADLIGLVQSFSVQPHGIENSLIVKLQNARNDLQAGDPAAACRMLDAFVNEVRAQAGKHIAGGAGGQADQLISAADQLKAAHGCP